MAAWIRAKLNRKPETAAAQEPVMVMKPRSVGISTMIDEPEPPAADPPKPTQPAIAPRPFSFRRCTAISPRVEDGYNDVGVMLDMETGQYWAVLRGKAQGNWCKTQDEAERLLDQALSL